MRAYRALAGYDAERIRALQLRAWLAQITINCGRNRARAQRSRPAEVHWDASPLAVTPPADPAPRPEAVAVMRESDAEWGRRLAALPDRYRAAVELRHVHGFSYEECAAALDRPVNTVKTHVHRGVALLRTAVLQEAESMTSVEPIESNGGDTGVPELSALRTTAPSELAPTVLVRVGLADEYFTAEAGIGPIFVAYNGRGVSATAPADRPGAPTASRPPSTLASGEPSARPGVRSRASSGPSSEALADGRPHGLAFDLRGLTDFSDRRAGGGSDHPAGRDPTLRLAGPRGRPAEGGPRRRHRARP